jgi:hypothetical protein
MADSQNLHVEEVGVVRFLLSDAKFLLN